MNIEDDTCQKMNKVKDDLFNEMERIKTDYDDFLNRSLFERFIDYIRYLKYYITHYFKY